MGIKQSRGFTLIELIIVLGILGVLLPTIFALFIAHVRAQSKVLVLQEVKRNGDTALQTITTLIKADARGIENEAGTPMCASSGTTSSGNVYFTDAQENRFMFHEDGGRIASESASTAYLTSDKVEVTDFTLTCQRDSQFSGPLVSVSFTVSQATQTTRAEESARLSYQSKVRLRNY